MGGSEEDSEVTSVEDSLESSSDEGRDMSGESSALELEGPESDRVISEDEDDERLMSCASAGLATRRATRGRRSILCKASSFPLSGP